MMIIYSNLNIRRSTQTMKIRKNSQKRKTTNARQIRRLVGKMCQLNKHTL